MSATITEIREDLISWLSKDGRTKAEIESRYSEVQSYVIGNLLTDMASKGQIKLMPGTNAKKWVSRQAYAAIKAKEAVE